MDLSWLHAINDFFAAHDSVEDPAVAYANAAELLFLGMLVFALLLAGRRHHGIRRAAVAAGLSAGVALAVGQVLSHLVDRPRPFVAHASSIHLFAHHAADSGFPSDHATAAFAIGVALLLRYRAWGVVVLIGATVLSLARVGMGIHYPSDVLAGAALGTLVALTLWLPRVRRLLDRLADLAGRMLDGVVAWARPPTAGAS
jgi:undecaprenyl-diphosphatase